MLSGARDNRYAKRMQIPPHPLRMGHLRRVHADALCGHGAQLQRFYRLPALYPLTLWVQQHAVLAAHHGALPFLHRWNDDGGAHLPPIHPARHRGHGRAARGLLAAALCRDERVPGLLPCFRHGRLRLFLGGDRAHLAAHRPLVPHAPSASARPAAASPRSSCRRSSRP